MSQIEPFAVLLSKPEKPDFMPIAKALAAVRKTPLQDSIMAAKGGWGIVAENMAEAEAASLVQALASGGLESVVCPSASLATLPAAAPATSLQALPSVPPLLIAAAAITITSTTTKTVKEGPSGAQKILSAAIFLGTGLPIRIGGKEQSVEKKQHHSDLVFCADLLYGDPPRRLRVDAQHFDYAFLKERKLYQVLGNFKLLLGDLAKAAPLAWKNHGTGVLLEGKPLQTMGYESLVDLERETRWLMTLLTRRG